MNYKLLSRTLGIICLLFSVTMLFSLPWAHPSLGFRHDIRLESPEFEFQGFIALFFSSLISAISGVALMWLGRGGKGGGCRR